MGKVFMNKSFAQEATNTLEAGFWLLLAVKIFGKRIVISGPNILLLIANFRGKRYLLKSVPTQAFQVESKLVDGSWVSASDATYPVGQH